MRFGISNLVLPVLTEVTRNRLCLSAPICDFAPTAFYESWTNVPAVLPSKPYGPSGPTIVALQSLFFRLPDVSLVREESSFTRLLEHFERLTSIAAASGIRILIFGSPATRTGKSAALTARALLDRVFTLADCAAARELTLCFEVNSKRFGCEYLVSTVELLGLLHTAQHSGLGLHLDVGQMLEEGVDVVRLLPTTSRELLHLHLSAPDFTCRPDLLPEYRKIVRALKDNGSEADVVLEVQKLGNATEYDLVHMCEALAEETGR